MHENLLTKLIILSSLMMMIASQSVFGLQLSTEQKLNQLRNQMKQYSIWAYIIPNSDAHMSEYVSSSDKRIAFISGFDGSAGTVLVTLDSALLWTDGRYWKQAENQLDSNYWKLMKGGIDVSLITWLTQNLKDNNTVGVDPLLYSVDEFNSLQKSVSTVKIIDHNLVDSIWVNRPPSPNGTIFELDLQFSGKPTNDKLSNIRTTMKSKIVDFYIVTSLDEIAWVLNLRGSDIEYNTVFFSYLIITMDQVRFYVDKSKFKDETIENKLKELNILTIPYTSYIDDVREMTQNQSVFIDPSYCNYATFNAIQSQNIEQGTSFIRFDKAIKNEVERSGFRNCHVRDGVAIVRYLAWLENELRLGHTINEFEGSVKLESFRAEGDYFLRSSFDTISAYGENAAIVHYSPTGDNHANIGTDNVYLLDSGGQYLDGTTDTTRTVHFGSPSEKVKRSFTLVLQGQLALSSLVFPSGLAGDKMDPIARIALWKDGLTYNHGTGHGVGHCLDVHEGPHGIGVPGFGFKEHYDVTIEPGYYEVGNFGIRIENLFLVRKSQTPYNFNNRTYLEFEQITFCPIQPSLVDNDLLSDKERNAVNEYNQQVLEKLMPFLSQDSLAKSYLERNTVPLPNPNTSSVTVQLIVAVVIVSIVLVCSLVANVYFIVKLKKQPKHYEQHEGELQSLSEERY